MRVKLCTTRQSAPFHTESSFFRTSITRNYRQLDDYWMMSRMSMSTTFSTMVFLETHVIGGGVLWSCHRFRCNALRWQCSWEALTASEIKFRVFKAELKGRLSAQLRDRGLLWHLRGCSRIIIRCWIQMSCSHMKGNTRKRVHVLRGSHRGALGQHNWWRIVLNAVASTLCCETSPH